VSDLIARNNQKNQGKQLSVHHPKYNVLHLDIMKQAFCPKNWTVPNCHVTEIDFSQSLESMQAKSNTFKW
jgi:pentose-5-phosphate-3-epimerase